MCGEHPITEHDVDHWSGSSPHVRGALYVAWGDAWLVGIIPACAGSTRSLSMTATTGRDHPRMCGEHRCNVLQNFLAGGSSPHVRGAPCAAELVDCSSGIIPACAGSTGRVLLGHDLNGDHPRMCGEHSGIQSNQSRATGSSPHVRGALLPTAYRGRADGIIPACAGSTSSNEEECFADGDHPRMCGEHH